MDENYTKINILREKLLNNEIDINEFIIEFNHYIELEKESSDNKNIRREDQYLFDILKRESNNTSNNKKVVHNHSCKSFKKKNKRKKR